MHWEPNAKIKMINIVIRCTNSRKSLTNKISETAFIFLFVHLPLGCTNAIFLANCHFIFESKLVAFGADGGF